MKAVAQARSPNTVNIASCHWQLLKTHSIPSSHNDNGSHDTNKRQALPRSRQRHSACRVGDFVYVFCGKDGTSALKDIWKYHIYDQTWELVKVQGGRLPLLQGHTTVAYKRLIVIFGGTFNNNVSDIQMWIFNTDLGHLREVWGEPGAVQPQCCRDHSTVVHQNLMYVFGGFKDPTGASQELWAFNIDEEEWTELTQLSHSRPGGRYGHTAVVWDNTMWVFGGSTGLSPCTDFWKYSFSLHQWTKLKCVTALPTVYGHSACVLHQQMLVVGGNCKGMPVNDVWSYRFDTNSLQRLSTVGMPLPGVSFHTCVSVSTPDPRSQQPTGRALSTPHLKPPSTSLLHPDRFLVRPRTSPSVLEVSAPGLCLGEEDRQSGVQDTRVEFMEDLNSEADCLENNSSNRVDPRIDVSLKEPLVPDSSRLKGFYKSCIPFSPWCKEQGDEELQVLHSRFGSGGCDSDSNVLDQTDHPSQGLNHAVTLDQVDHSTSPVLKASRHGCKSIAIKQEIIFWNDMFIEDLEASDEVGLSEVKISYPSKNPLLPLSGFLVNGCDGAETVRNMSPWHLWGTEHTDQQHCNHSLHPHKHLHSPHDTEHKHSEWDKTDAGQRQNPESSQVRQIRPSLHTSAGDKQWSSQGLLSTNSPAKGPSSQERNRLNPQQLDYFQEEETSFINGGERAWSKSVSERNSEEPFHAARDYEPRSTAAGGVAHGMEKRTPAAGSSVKEEMMLEEPFLLVLGGKTEEQITTLPKPIAVWKGAFV